MKQKSKERLFQTVGPVKEKDLSPGLSVRSWHTECEAVRR